MSITLNLPNWLRAGKLSNVIAMTMVLLACMISAISIYNGLDNLHTEHDEASRDSVDRAKLKIEKSLKEKQWLTQVFFVNNRETLEALIEHPADEKVFETINQKLGRYFIDFHAFNILRSSGELVADDFDGNLGEICQADMLHFHESNKTSVRLHPNSVRYHYDIPHSVEHDGQQYVVFVSFDFGSISSIMRDIQVDDHSLYLVDRDQNDLIEATAFGARNILLNRDSFMLDDEEKQNIFAEADIDDTRWHLVDIVTPGYLEEKRVLLVIDVLTVLAASLLLIMIIWHSLQRHENRLQRMNAALADRNKAISTENKALKKFSITDALTGLYNRRYFDEVAEMRWGDAIRTSQTFTLVMVDVDHFKRFNDTYGHPAGDDCLTQLSKTMSGTYARKEDVVARYGGEEFILLTTGGTYTESLQLVNRLRDSIENLQITHSTSDAGEHVTISCGLVHIIPNRELDLEQLIERADNALYEAKRSGRNCVVAYDYTSSEQVRSISSGEKPAS